MIKSFDLCKKQLGLIYYTGLHLSHKVPYRASMPADSAHHRYTLFFLEIFSSAKKLYNGGGEGLNKSGGGGGSSSFGNILFIHAGDHIDIQAKPSYFSSCTRLYTSSCVAITI